MNPSLAVRDSKWQIQYGRSKLKKLLGWNEIWYSAVPRIDHYESKLDIQKIEMWDPIWQTKMQKFDLLA